MKQCRLVFVGQRGTKEEKGQGGRAEEYKGWRVYRWGRGAESQPQNMSHHKLSSFFLFLFSFFFSKISIPVQFVPAQSGAGRNYRNVSVSGAFPTSLQLQHRDTHPLVHFQSPDRQLKELFCAWQARALWLVRVCFRKGGVKEKKKNNKNATARKKRNAGYP